MEFNTKAQKKRFATAYKRSVDRTYKYRKKGKEIWETLTPEEKKIRSKTLKKLEREEKSITPTIPKDADYKRIQYMRYADYTEVETMPKLFIKPN